MAVMAGGQMIKKLAIRAMGLDNKPTTGKQQQQGVASFSYKHPASNFEAENEPDIPTTRAGLKSAFRATVNKLGDSLDEDVVRGLLEESRAVFARNNAVVKAIKLPSRALARCAVFVGGAVALAFACVASGVYMVYPS